MPAQNLLEPALPAASSPHTPGSTAALPGVPAAGATSVPGVGHGGQGPLQGTAVIAPQVLTSSLQMKSSSKFVYYLVCLDSLLFNCFLITLVVANCKGAAL